MRTHRFFLFVASGCTALSLAGCSVIPDLAPESLAANKAACDSVTSAWNALSTALDPAALTDGQALQSSSEALAGIPEKIQSAIDGSTDASLDSALEGLKKQIDSLMSGTDLDIASLATAGANLAARCAVFGVTPNLTLPGM